MKLARIALLLLVLGLALAASVTGCSKPVTPRVADQPPVTRLFLAGPVDSANYRFRMHWSGDDPDGDVAYFEIQLDPGRIAQPPATGWDTTTKVDSIFAPDIRNGRAEYTFWVRAVDNKGLRDPHPASIILTLLNHPPTVQFVNLPHRLQGGQYHFLPVLSLQWQGSDPEGYGTLKNYHLWLDGVNGGPSTFDTTFSPSDTVFTLRLENFGDVSQPSIRTVHLSVQDEALAIGDTVTYSWPVDAYTVPSSGPRVLLVDDYHESGLVSPDTVTLQDAMYSGAVNRLTGGQFTTYNIWDQNNFRFEKDAQELLRHYDYIIWYAEGGNIPTNFILNRDAIMGFLDSGKSMYLSATTLLDQDTLLTPEFWNHYMGVSALYYGAPKSNPPRHKYTGLKGVVFYSHDPAAPNDSLAITKLQANDGYLFAASDSAITEFAAPFSEVGGDSSLTGDRLCAVTRQLPSSGKVTYFSLPLYLMGKYGNNVAVLDRLLNAIKPAGQIRRRPFLTYRTYRRHK